MMGVTLSIIIPVYNAGRFLAKAVESLLRQSFQDFEVILVDDGSKDGSLSIAREFARQDDRIKVFSKPNGGVSSARNLGLENASGEWVSFLDADDELLEGALDYMVKSVLGSDCNLAMFGFVYSNPDGGIYYKTPEKPQCVLILPLAVQQLMAPMYGYYQGYVVDKLFRRQIIRENSIRFDEDIFFNEDRLFVTRYMLAQDKEVILDTTPVYKYITRDTGTMRSAEKGFNPKFITDLVAQIRIMRLIQSTMSDSEGLMPLAQDAVYKSYCSIRNMALSCPGKESKSVVHNAFSIMRKALPLRFVVRKQLSHIKWRIVPFNNR